MKKVQLQPDPAETEITQPPVFRWKNGDFTLPDNTIFTWRKLQVKPYNGEVGTLAGGVVKVKGTDTVAPASSPSRRPRRSTSGLRANTM